VKTAIFEPFSRSNSSEVSKFLFVMRCFVDSCVDSIAGFLHVKKGDEISTTIGRLNSLDQRTKFSKHTMKLLTPFEKVLKASEMI
jgi:hypothetical protein